MLWRFRIAGLTALACTLTLLACFFASGAGRSSPSSVANAASAGPPRLVVLVIFDQMRGDYLSRWQDLFGEDGFRRLLKEGAWFSNCHYPYADTFTAPGHASILAGCSPAEHGIIGNEWYDRASREEVSCVATSRYQRVVGSPESEEGLATSQAKDKAGASPERLLVPSFGDALKQATGGKARIVSLSMKDRSALLPAGHHPDACYWFDTSAGVFVTSTYYRDRLHSWVNTFNRDRPADRWRGRRWQRLRPDLDYVRYSGPDDAAGEGIGFAQGRVFPHPMTGGQKNPGRLYYQALFNSPFGNELLLDLAKRAIDAEQLGGREVPDLLCVSFSSNDLIGHCWGPDSQEVLDVTLRSDRIIQQLLAHLDARVGKGRYLLALTADHGVCPLPEVARTQGKDAGRVSPELLGADAEAFLDKTFGPNNGKARWLEAQSDLWVYLNRGLLRERGLDAAEVEEALCRWLKQQPGVLTAYGRSQLVRGMPPEDVLGTRVRRSFYPERSGDVEVVLKPYHLLSLPLATGTTHGTPHSYDTHVPLVVYGPGIRKGIRREEVTPLSTAAIFARALAVKAPASAKAPVPEGLFNCP